MSLQIMQVSPAQIEALQNVVIGIPAVAYVAIDDGALVGSYGLAWAQGRCWAWLRLDKPKRSYGLPVARLARKLMRKAWQLGETEVFTPRDADYPTSEKLLKTLGFKMFAIEHDVEVWRYERV